MSISGDDQWAVLRGLPPKTQRTYNILWQVFWLTSSLDDLPIQRGEQWSVYPRHIMKLTAAGTAPDFHRIPY